MIVIKSNSTSLSDILIPDLGIIIPFGGGQDEFTSTSDIAKIKSSFDVLRLATDDFGDGNPSIILNDGTKDIPIEDIEAFLSSSTELEDPIDAYSSSGSYVYIGRKLDDALPSDASWQIYRYTKGEPASSIVWADGNQEFDNVWNNRLGLTYLPIA